MNLTNESTLRLIEWNKITEALTARATTPPGKAFASKIAPLSIDDARIRLELISEMKESLIRGERCDFTGLADVRASAIRAEKGSTLSLSDLFAVRSTVIAAHRIRLFFTSKNELMNRVSVLAESIPDITECTKILSQAFTDDGSINGKTYPQIGRIERAIISLRDEIERSLSKMVHSTNFENVIQEKIVTERQGRYVILVKSSMRSRVKGTVLDASASSATVYVEPESVSEKNDEIMMRRAEMEREIERIIAELSIVVGENGSSIITALQVAAEIDFLNGCSLLSRDIRGNAPLIENNPIIDLISARHPLLSLIMKEGVIANDIDLGKRFSSLIITGANTGGKTVLLKTIALSVVMAAHGLHIAASPDSRVGIFDTVLADIGDDQNLEMSLSTFSGKVVALVEMLSQASPNSLILIDEIMAGTNPRHGAALARAVLESFADNNARVAITTHYPELRNLASEDSRFANGSVSFDTATLKPTYQLTTGLPGASFTLEIASRYGMPQSVITRAESLTSSDELSVDALLERITRFKEEIAAEREHAASLTSELALERERLGELEKKLKDEKHRVSKGEGLAFLDEIRHAREESARKISELHNAGAKRANELVKEIAEIESVMEKKIKILNEENIEGIRASDTKSPLEKGTRVLVIPLEKEGIVEEGNSDKKIAVVRLGNVFSRFSYDELVIRSLPEEPKKGKLAVHSSKTIQENDPIPVTTQTSYNTVDLRGLRLDEALIKLDASLDRMAGGSIPSAVIIHGHGTGALKTGIRQALKSSPYIIKFRSGEKGEGGDGVTIALFRG